MSSTDVEPAFVLLLLSKVSFPPALAALIAVLALLYLSPGGIAWSLSLSRSRSIPIPGPHGIVTALSGTAAHRVLSSIARAMNATHLMAFSVGATRFVVSSHPATAKEILSSPAFADRPIKESAYELLFHRAMGFAPSGEYWRGLRRISAAHLFSPRRLAAFGHHQRAIGDQMVRDVRALNGAVEVKRMLHFASLNNVMMSVFGRSFDFAKGEGVEVEELVREGYELLGAFNWSDHVPLIGWLDLQGVRKRCQRLAKRVSRVVGDIIDEHKMRPSDVDDFVDVLLSLEKDDKLSESDIIAVLWEMIFRGTDTVAILLEWIIARMVLHPEIQAKAQAEIKAMVGESGTISHSHISNLRYIQCIVKESLRMHPPGPLLSWARLAIHDVHVGDYVVPAGTTAMVNMWAISHDQKVWPEPSKFRPERFMEEDVSVLGSDLRLAPFGSGRRVCPGKTMGLATVHLWLAQLLREFNWLPSPDGVDLSECLNMSLEMKNPLVCRAVPRGL